MRTMGATAVLGRVFRAIEDIYDFIVYVRWPGWHACWCLFSSRVVARTSALADKRARAQMFE